MFFEDTIRLFSKHQVVIQETGAHSIWGDFGVKTENVFYMDNDTQITYDMSMVNFKNKLLDFDWDVVVFLDNDLYLSGLSYFNKTLIDFEKGKFDFCSYFENTSDKVYQTDTTIAEVKDQTFIDVPEYPKFKPVPHWENAYMYLTRELYQKLSHESLSNSRLMIKAIYDSEAKMGSKKRTCRSGYSHFGQEWFHVGNLMKYYYALETADMTKVNRESEIDIARIGYFIAHDEKYPNSFPGYLKQSYMGFAHWMGMEKVKKVWKEYIKDTCLEYQNYYE
jgi:hypothetical protein